ncbi:flocculation protein FLO11 isoform X1 [Scleropages formosus]|uniref:flocculation protein FLO11 isoform X1 n=1 Tax=Scleropages formosus TaxID=113540 RepID=UPI0010FA6909|nr:flocculation protein FLO11-like isoform X1 [Scleropages formosus]XP_029109749.1 flocculation protein FLO11-like isoform X1 [Scleropages formosus]
MRHTELSVIMYLPSLLAFSATTLSSTTAEPFSRSTTLTSEALTAGAKTERPNPQNMSTNRDPSAETAKQDSFASERMTTPASRHRPSERSGVTKVVEFRARTVESNPWKNPAETPYATSGQGATTQHNLRAHREPTAGNMETTAHRQESPETSSSHMDARAMGDPRPAPATYSSTTWDKRSTAPANHNTTGPVATSTVELHSNTYTGLHASADTHRTPTAYNMATEVRDHDLGKSTQMDQKTELCNPQSNNTISNKSQPKCGKREVKPVPLSKSTKLVCFVTLCTLGVTASVFFGLTMFLWVRLSVHRGKVRKRWMQARGEQSTLWAQPKGTLEQRVEFWYANSSSVAPEQAAVRAQPLEDTGRRREPETLWTPPRVTLEDITEFWYSNGRTRPHIERSKV